MKKWQVRFKKIMDKEWIVCDKPFQSQQSAEFFAQTIQITVPGQQAEAFEGESNG